ncbi:MAG: phage regulatory CII family protein [Desulfurobacteriaceae bacterium]
MEKQFWKKVGNKILKEGVQKLISQGQTVPATAKLLGISEYQMVDILYKDKVVAFPKVCQMVANGAVGIVEGLADLCNCVVVELPEQFEPLERGKEAAKVLKEVGDVIQKYGQAIEDGKITEEERVILKKEIKEAIITLLALELRVEEAYREGE